MFLSRIEVYTYKKAQLIQYISHREKEGVKVFTLAQVEKRGVENSFDDSYNGIDIDLTSAIKLLINNEYSFKYPLESMLENLDGFDEIRFIVDEKYEQELLIEFPYFFSGNLPLEIESEEGPVMSKENNSNLVKRRIVDLNETEIKALFKRIEDDLVGHETLKIDLTKKISEFLYFYKKIKDQPILSFFLLGPSGLGKTEIARIIHNFLDEDSPIAKINFGNYSSESSLASLIGSPPGFKDSGEESDLIKKLKNSNSGVLIIDEFEKANKNVHNFFLQLLEEGKFDDAMGEIFDLSGYLIIFTSNLKKSEFMSHISPELRSRFNGIYLMMELSEVEKNEYANKVIDWYFNESKEEKTTEKVESIIKKVDIKNENNLRTIKFRLRSAFYLTHN
ncbi:ATP-dependent Clp protease ATP-binding subunit ClpC [Psychrobacillus insolitus]|uniref:ATP-dependent Clp protease ATP-binding subunit ClpC n=1 Tax=Psychrobacillus insolitus TaxID=1461 RepID=A0A2W7MDG9_9BACI|nr:ATP-dependent Clp protease ATP-binding subunit ClpC [Psychrobacillus insolitus]